MKFPVILLFFPLLLSMECNKKKNDIPSCIRVKIEKIKSEARWNPPAEVKEYIYKGKTVYLFSADCCDQFDQLLDKDCNYVCAPSGGITGKGDMKCPDFSDSAQFIRSVWKDPR